jgi:KaiC/GvpD/RAD55 family RecA-like ATPase
LKQQLNTREEIEEEMLVEGDRLTELSIQQERLTYEQQLIMQASDAGEDYDEARALEIELELEDVATESESITQTLDTLDEHLLFVSEKINKLKEDITGFDMDSIQPPRFKGLSSVEMARKTLRTFFMVLLDLNVYKRDLETKCLEQDERIIDLTMQVTVLSESTRGVDRVALVRKQKAMVHLVSKLGEEFIDNRDTENLELTT